MTHYAIATDLNRCVGCLDASKVELTSASATAKGCQPSIQSPDVYVDGKLEIGHTGGDELGQYSKKVN